MTSKICDTCKKEVKELHTIVDEFKTDRVNEVCHDCLMEINNLLNNVRKAQLIQMNNFIRRFIRSIVK